MSNWKCVRKHTSSHCNYIYETKSEN